MLRFLVRGDGLGVAINLHQHEPCRVVLLLQDVEAQDAQLQQTQARVEAVASLNASTQSGLT